MKQNQARYLAAIRQATGLPWEDVPTGGGCTALVAVFADGWSVRLTANAQVPTLGETALLELFEGEPGAGDPWEQSVCRTVAGVAAECVRFTNAHGVESVADWS